MKDPQESLGLMLYNTHAVYVVPTVYSPVCALQDFAGDFSDLGGVMQQRRQEMMESSSSSGSQTPDYEKLSGVCFVL